MKEQHYQGYGVLSLHDVQGEMLLSTQQRIQQVISSRNTLADTPRRHVYQLSGYPLVWSS